LLNTRTIVTGFPVLKFLLRLSDLVLISGTFSPAPLRIYPVLNVTKTLGVRPLLLRIFVAFKTSQLHRRPRLRSSSSLDVQARP